MKKDYRKKRKELSGKFFSEMEPGVIVAAGVFCAGILFTVVMEKNAVWWQTLFIFLLYGLHRKNMYEEKRKIKFYKGLENFVDNLQMFYGYYGDIKEAVYDAMISAGKYGYLFGKKMDLYLQDRFEESKMEACEPREIQLLEIGRCAAELKADALCIQDSLRRFKEELREEIFRMEEIRTHYSGLMEVCLFPALTMPLLAGWAVSNLEELEKYYSGFQGMFSSVLVLLLTGVIFCLLTNLHFEKKSGVSEKRELAGEILRFHNWILLQKNSKEANVENLLEGFIGMAAGLKQKVERLYYEYMEKGSEAIARAREEELYLPYVRILEGLMLCDRVPMENAFSNVETERGFQLERLKNENRKMIQEKTALGKVLAFLPLYCVSCLMLIVPFVMEGLERLSTYSESFGTLL